jgi:hypothetical protein
MKLKRLWFQLLDAIQSDWNQLGPQVDPSLWPRKLRRRWLKWGRDYGQYTRRGRRFTRFDNATDRAGRVISRGNRGWAWFCDNCHDYSITRNPWDGCTRCNFLPGAPE